MNRLATTFSILLTHYSNLDLTIDCVRSLVVNQVAMQIMVVDHSPNEEVRDENKLPFKS